MIEECAAEMGEWQRGAWGGFRTADQYVRISARQYVGRSECEELESLLW